MLGSDLLAMEKCIQQLAEANLVSKDRTMSQMMKVNLVMAFTATPDTDGGNPAGVVLNADHLSEEQMQAIARETGYSETAFVSKSAIAGFKLDFFTPVRRIPDCGHATVATFSLLNRLYPELTETSKEILGGQRREILIRDGKVFMEQPMAKVETVPFDSSLFKNQVPIQSSVIARHDNGFLLLEVNSEMSLKDLVPDQEKIKAYSEQNEIVGIYVFTPSTSWNDSDYSTRMFAPAYGILEESATGMAAGLLTGYLFQRSGKKDFEFDQGRWMTSPSLSVLSSQVLSEKNRVLVGGYASLKN